jgi:hypothetical protein
MENKYLELYNLIFPTDSENEFEISVGCFDFYKKNNKISRIKKAIINLLDAEYVIFPTNRFDHFHYYMFGSSYKYFKKTKTVCINYYLRFKILQKLNVINKLIKTENKLKDKLKDKIKDSLFINRLKPIYFLENQIEPNTFYRKIKFAQEEIYMSFDTFAVKRIEFKLKSICQLVEKMGAKKISIFYKDEESNETKIESSLAVHGIDNALKNNSTQKRKINFKMERIFNEENQKNNINLNYNELENIINKENEFFIDKSQFLADIDIKFLLQSRCANLIEEYENTLFFEYANKFEKELFAKAMNFGFKLNFAVDILTTQELKIKIDYLNPFKDRSCVISGYNISPYESGYNHLIKLINQLDDDNSNYLKINNFLEAELKLLNDKKSLLDFPYNNNIDLLKTFNHIINCNFDLKEIESLFSYYFQNNSSYRSYQKFRNILLKPIDNFIDYFYKTNYFNLKNNKNKYNFYDNIIKLNENENERNNIYNEMLLNKLVFTSNQYHFILDYRLKIMDMLDEALEKIKDKVVKQYNYILSHIDDISVKYEEILKQIKTIKGKNHHGISNRSEINYLYTKYELNFSKLDTVTIYDKIIKNKALEFDFPGDKEKQVLFEQYFDEITDEVNTQQVKNLIKDTIKDNLFDKVTEIKNITSKTNLSDEQFSFDENFKNNKTFDNIYKINKLDSILSLNLDSESFILQSLYFLMDDQKIENNKYDLSDYLSNIKQEIPNNFKKISDEIKILFGKLFYEENGFFGKFKINKYQGELSKTYSVDHQLDLINKFNLRDKLIEKYKSTKVSDLDDKIILILYLLFEKDYFDIRKINNHTSIFNNIYSLFDEIFFNSGIRLQISNSISFNKLINNYQKYKIFITYDNFCDFLKNNYSDLVSEENNNYFDDSDSHIYSINPDFNNGMQAHDLSSEQNPIVVKNKKHKKKTKNLYKEKKKI